MPSIRYARNELRRRRTRTVLTSFGLASGVGLVMGIVGVSDGLDEAQAKVLSPLSSVGTDILVTRTVGATSSTPSATPSPSATTQNRRGGGGFFSSGAGPGGGPGGRDSLSSLNDADATALLNENSSVITDLSKLGKAGTKFTHDFFLAGTMLTFPSAALDTINGIHGVASATSALTLQAQHQTGTVPNIVANVKTGGETLTTTARPKEMTAAEQAAFRSCIQKNGGFGGPVTVTGPPPGSGSDGGTRVRRFDIGGFGAVNKCLPKRFQEYEAKVVTPLRTIQQIVNPPQTDTQTQSWTAAGVDPKSPDAGLITRKNISTGSWFTGASNEVVLSTAYAGKHSLKVGSAFPVNGKSYQVIGLADPTLTGNTADVYFPISTLQSIAGKSGRVNEVLVKVSDASRTAEVAAAIKKALPGAQVVTSKDLADTVTGSLHDAQQLANRLGGALTVIVLLSTFAIAVLLTLSSVQKRIREIGTLRALGWAKRRVVGQLLTETAGIGVLAGLVGIAVGYVVSAAVGAFSPSLSATSSGVAAGASSVSDLFGQTTTALTRSVSLSAPIHPSTIALGMACALAGALIAGAVGGWRAARLSPAVALRDLG